MKFLLAGITGVLFLSCLSPLAFAQGPVACTEMGCVNGLTISVPPEMKWEPGKYNFVFVLDGAIVNCAGELPLEPCDKSPTIKCQGKGVQISENGCALSKEMQSFGDIQISSAPKKVIMRITRNDKPLLTRTYYPTYKTSAPNGPQCQPVCNSANIELN